CWVGWKLLNDSDALVTRVYKAKYFPRGDFLSAALGGSPSYIWRSIGSTQKLLQRGIRWRLGDGASVKVFKDPWLRDDHDCWVQALPEVGMEDIRVCELCIPGLHEWDEELLDELFTDRDVACIRRMQAPSGNEADGIIWQFSRDGRYTVRSAYRLGMEVLVDDTSLHQPGEWSLLWSLAIPPRMRHFLWRVARDVLPTRGALRRRRLPISGECGLCAGVDETSWHLFVTCPIAITCWEVAGLLGKVEEAAVRTTSIAGWLFELLRISAPDKDLDVVAVMWGLWKERNERVWQHTSRPEEMVVKQGRDAVKEWCQRDAGRSLAVATQPSMVCKKWHRPPVGVLKLNVDAAFFANEVSFGIGLALRGRAGQLM
ncbi:Putative ribonuclease H protein At1g65750, partial [Linum grandiflorum]